MIASARLIDPNFARSVVLLCDHDEEKGTYGIVLNQPIEVTPEVLEALPFPLGRLHQGGPVRPEALQVLHPYGDIIPGGLKVLPGLWLGGDFETLAKKLEAGQIDVYRCRFFIGYSGWDKGQLAREFAEGSWLRVHGDTALIEHTLPDELWAAAIRLYGREHPLYQHFPANPELN